MYPHIYPPGTATGYTEDRENFKWETVEWGKCPCGLWHSNRVIPDSFWNKKWTGKKKQREKVGVILFKDNRELWVTQSYNNCFGFPKGEKESDETPIVGAAREFYEETGTKIQIETLKKCKKINAKIRDIFYTFYIWNVPKSFELTTYPLDDVEITSCGWIDISNIGSLRLSKAIQKIFNIFERTLEK